MAILRVLCCAIIFIQKLQFPPGSLLTIVIKCWHIQGEEKRNGSLTWQLSTGSDTSNRLRSTSKRFSFAILSSI